MANEADVVERLAVVRRLERINRHTGGYAWPPSDPTLLADIEDEMNRLRERLGPRGLEPIIINGIGHYVSEAVRAEITSLRSALSSAKAEEREACAAICDAEHRANIHTIAISLGSDARAMTAYKLAAAIRSRKDTP